MVSVPQARPTAEATPAPAASAATPLVDLARAKLAAFDVSDTRVARRVLYTWTTAAQVKELDKNPVLLSRTERPGVGRSFYQQVLELDALQTARPASVMLSGPAFAKLRFAWPHAWPTAIGPDGEAYGDQLVRVTLRSSAVFGRFDTQAGWTFVDMENQSVAEAEALAHPERIAAVYFANRGNAVDAQGQTRAPYREYVLVNESQIEEWSLGTRAIQEELDGAADALRAVWAACDDRTRLAELAGFYESSLAFAADFPPAELRGKVGAVLDALESAKGVLAARQEHAPRVAFVPNPPVPKAPPPPPPPRRRAGTRWIGTF